MGIEFINFNLPHTIATHNVNPCVEAEKRRRQIRHEDRPASVPFGDEIAFVTPPFETGFSELERMFLVKIETPGFLTEISAEGPHIPDFAGGHPAGCHGQKGGHIPELPENY